MKESVVYKTDYGCVHLKDPLEPFERTRGLSPRSVFLSVIDMSITVTKACVKQIWPNQCYQIYDDWPPVIATHFTGDLWCFIISPNEVFGDIMVASPPCLPPTVDPDDMNTLTRKIFNLFQIIYVGRYPPPPPRGTLLLKFDTLRALE